MSCIQIEDEIVCIGDDSFRCPHCGKVYDDEKYTDRINRNKWGYTMVYCSCGKPFNVTMNFYGEMPLNYNVVINTDHPMMKNLLESNNEEEKGEKVKQLIDLALLSNGLLKGESLTNFVKRSYGMIN